MPLIEEGRTPWSQSGMDINDPYDSPGYYESGLYRPHSFERKPREVEVRPNFRETYVLPTTTWVLACKANDEQHRGYQSLTIPAGTPLWRGQCWDVKETSLEDCYFTEVEGTVYYFNLQEAEDKSLIPVSVARAIFLHLCTKLRS